MKTTMRNLVMLLLALVMLPTVAHAQFDPASQLPLMPQVREGVLPNGMTYFIMHNETPKGLADFYIAQKVGSILEEDNQRGLAHFLEHMCFNGTENFPGTSLRDWLSSKGVKFGNDLNAYTGIDETVYMIKNVPVANEAVQDSCLLILHDWADALLLEPEEIDAERGVIHQEWRMSNVGQMRILEGLLPTIYPGSRYGYRLPIGTMEVVDNFPYQALRDYYETWYRPDQQGLIIVGDIDVDRIENKIKEMFGPIKMPENAKVREYFPVPEHKGTIYAIGHDKEMPYTVAEVMYMTEATPDEVKNTAMYLVQLYVQDVIETMMNERIQKLTLDPNCPLLQGGISFGDFFVSRTREAMTMTAVSKSTEIEPALELMYRELLRAARGGFTQSEYDRARAEYLSNLENVYNNRATAHNDSYVQELKQYFLRHVAAPGVETEYQLMNMFAPNIPLEAVNSVLPEVLSDDNRVVLVMMPDAERYPTEEGLAGLLKKVDGETIEAFVDNVKTEPLVPSLPTPGKVVSTEQDSRFDATVWTLSNGVKVWVKKTPYKEDQILFNALSNQGTSIYPDSEAANIIFIDNAPVGLGSYTVNDLGVYLKGKNASLTSSIDAYSTDLEGSAAPKDLNTLMEMIYMSFVDPTVDATEFEAVRSQLQGLLPMLAAQPKFQFSVAYKKALYESAREQELSVDVVNAADPAKIQAMVKELMSNAANFDFYFVGNVDLDVLKPLVEQYIATLPADASKAVKMPEFIADTQMRAGSGIDTSTMAMETPQTFVLVNEWANVPYTAENRILCSIANQILTQRLIDNVREKEGAVYSISSMGLMRRVSPQNTRFYIPVPIDPDKRDKVLELIKKEFDGVAASVTDQEVKKVQEYLVKTYNDGLERNEFWIGQMGGYGRNNVDTFTGYVDMVNSVTPAQVSAFLKSVNDAGNYRVVLLEPEAK